MTAPRPRPPPVRQVLSPPVQPGDAPPVADRSPKRSRSVVPIQPLIYLSAEATPNWTGEKTDLVRGRALGVPDARVDVDDAGGALRHHLSAEGEAFTDAHPVGEVGVEAERLELIEEPLRPPRREQDPRPVRLEGDGHADALLDGEPLAEEVAGLVIGEGVSTGLGEDQPRGDGRHLCDEQSSTTPHSARTSWNRILTSLTLLTDAPSGLRRRQPRARRPAPRAMILTVPSMASVKT